MTRENLIQAIYDNEDAWSCIEHNGCDKPEEEGNTGDCCWACAEKQLQHYEKRKREEVIDECKNLAKNLPHLFWSEDKLKVFLAYLESLKLD